MPTIIKSCEDDNKSIVDKDNGVLSMTYFNVVQLGKGERFVNQVDGFETVYVVLRGNCDIKVDDESFTSVGQRKNIWSGNADSVYAPSAAEVQVISNQNGTEIAIAGGKCGVRNEPYRIKPEEVEMVDVGSVETHTHRRIFHILGNKDNGRVGNLLVSELYCDEGCWSGYPPHKHDEDLYNGNGYEETGFEEVYHYRFNPTNGFGAQFTFQHSNESRCYMIRNGDTVLIDKGYHPTVTSPGHQVYIFTVLVGHTQRSLVQNFKKEYQYLTESIPGISAMCAKFR